jgi:sn-glycerol 3-phosphate transport system ATP-binding protein
MYTHPASVFTARFIGTPPMNLLAIESGCIGGTDIAVNASAATLGVRPEAISLRPEGVHAVVQSVEYLGADLVLHCRIGSQKLLARLHGQHIAAPGDSVRLYWAPHEAHLFDTAGHRLP